MEMKRVEQNVGNEGAGDNEFAMRKVDDAQHAIEHVETAAQERINRTDDDAVSEALHDEKRAHLGSHEIAPEARLLPQERADDAARHELDEEHDDETEKKKVGDREVLPDEIVDADEDRRAHHRPAHGAEPAHGGVDDSLCR